MVNKDEYNSQLQAIVEDLLASFVVYKRVTMITINIMFIS